MLVMASKSVVKFTPKTEMDFGSLVCWASNQVGLGSPCVYHLLPIGPPDPPTDCYTHNITYSTVQMGTGGAPLCIIYTELNLPYGESSIKSLSAGFLLCATGQDGARGVGGADPSGDWRDGGE